MNVIDTLPCPRPAINNHAEAIFRDPLISSQLSGRTKDITDKPFISLPHVEEGGYVLARNNQEMDRGLGVDIPKGHNRVVLIDDVSFNIAFDDAAKKTVAHFTFSPLVAPAKNDNVDSAFFVITTSPLLKALNNSTRNMALQNNFLILLPTLFGHYSHPERSEGSEFDAQDRLREESRVFQDLRRFTSFRVTFMGHSSAESISQPVSFLLFFLRTKGKNSFPANF